MGLGLKIKNGVDRIGRKANATIDKFGKKANGVINRVDNAADTIIDKSGGVTNALRQGAKIGNQIVHGINESGLREVPVVGSVTSALEKGTKQLSRGADKLDQVRDNIKERKDELAKNARSAVNETHQKAINFI